MSIRRRIVRTSSVALTVLALGSIAAACFTATSSFAPKKAFAQESAPNPGILGVGERKVAPLAAPISAASRLAGVPSPAFAPAPSPALALKVATKIPKPVVAKKQIRRGRVAANWRVSGSKRVALAPASNVSTKGWSRALCSWYGPGFYGRTMASGGRLGYNSMIVAHKTMRFGTRIQFSYKGRTVIAVVRDRGPYIHGRVFDLGPGTAKALGFSGVGMVSYRILGR